MKASIKWVLIFKTFRTKETYKTCKCACPCNGFLHYSDILYHGLFGWGSYKSGRCTQPNKYYNQLKLLLSVNEI
jgi:hypothetical protein